MRLDGKNQLVYPLANHQELCVAPKVGDTCIEIASSPETTQPFAVMIKVSFVWGFPNALILQ